VARKTEGDGFRNWPQQKVLARLIDGWIDGLCQTGWEHFRRPHQFDTNRQMVVPPYFN
jgi:hypothetical protein